VPRPVAQLAKAGALFAQGDFFGSGNQVPIRLSHHCEA
jgi:hypothetical protein